MINPIPKPGPKPKKPRKALKRTAMKAPGLKFDPLLGPTGWYTNSDGRWQRVVNGKNVGEPLPIGVTPPKRTKPFVVPNGSASPPAGPHWTEGGFITPDYMKIRLVTHGVHRLKFPKTNPERKRERHMRDFDGGIQHDHFVRAKGCALGSRIAGTPCGGSIQAAHVTARSVGGRWFDLVGLCDNHHRLHERIGTSGFMASNCNLVALARENVLENLKEKGAI